MRLKEQNLGPKFVRTIKESSYSQLEQWRDGTGCLTKSNRQQTRRTSERDVRTRIFEFQRNRDQNKDSIQGTPVNLLR
jgi:hypothetical protein